VNLLLKHIAILPVVTPLLTAAVLLFLKDTKQHNLRAPLAIVSTLLQLFIAIKLLIITGSQGGASESKPILVYLLGDWPAPFGIVLVADQLAAIMLTLTAIVALATLIYGTARWDRVGVHFLPLFQLLLMGINGAFLTGDLFNLFVFFEVLLAASYGLMLHGSGELRVSAGLHYIAVNLLASFLLLIGIALIYGSTGTLNMADLAVRAGQLSSADRQLF